ncbi:MAG: hydroxyacid dehydrogenase [Planctomycetes bacterium]|nr:hydroxyacid dehydrogenase [Planctomycetota bacterium]
MKLLVADKLPPRGLDMLRDAGYEVDNDPGLSDDALTARVAEGGAQVLIVRSTKVPRATLEAGKLSLVIRAGAGYNNVDVEAASELGIYVANCPGKNAVAVAELTFGLLLAIDRHIPESVQAIRDGKWNKKDFSKAQGVFGRTLGVIGLGEIGRQVVTRAHAFGMRVVAWSRSLTDAEAEELGVERANDLSAVAFAADVVSVHVALTEQTKGLIGSDFFAALRPGTIFLNTSRGAVVDGAALRRAVEDKGVRAGLDVWNVQPSDSVGTFADPLGGLEGVYGTHHIGASTDQAQEAVAEEAVRVARAYREHGKVPNCVNLTDRSLATAGLVVRHADKVGVLAFVLQTLKAANLNVEDMENIVFHGGKAACATIRVSHAPPEELIDQINAHEHIFGVRVTA